MRIALVCNPVSGNGKGRQLAPHLVGALERRGHAVDEFRTRAPGDATEWARTGIAGADRILVLGGDGTLNEVLNGLEEPGRRPIAQLPTGTANLLAHDLDLPRDPEGIAAMLETGRIRHVDMGLAAERRFLLVVSAGFDAMVTRDIRERRTATLGYRGYAAPVLQTLRRYRPPCLTVSVDGDRAVEGQMVVVSNTRNYGGLFTLADRARCDSGHLDVCVVENASIGGLVRAGVAGLTGGLSSRNDVVYRTGRSVRIRADDPVEVEVDGDYVGTTPIDVVLQDERVPIVVPPER